MENIGYKEGTAKPMKRQRVSRAASVAMCESDIPLSAQHRYVNLHLPLLHLFTFRMR